MQLKGFAYGAVIAALLLATQLVGYYGASNLVKDIKSTIVSRNFADEHEVEKTKLKNIEFYAKNNVMFMPNYEAGKNKRRIGDVLKNSFGRALIHVPILCLVGAFFSIAVMALRHFTESVEVFYQIWKKWKLDAFSTTKIVIFFSVLWYLYISIFYKYGEIVNWADGENFFRSGGRGLPGLVLGSLALGVCSSWLAQGKDRQKLLAGLILLIIVSLIIQSTKPVEMKYFRSLAEGSASAFVYFAGSLLMPFWVLSSRPCDRKKEMKFTYVFFSALIAVILLTPIFAGYLSTGYINRCCPLVTFGIFPNLAMAVRNAKESLLYINPSWSCFKLLGRGIAGCILVAWVCSAWSFYKYLPPHGAESIRRTARIAGGEGVVTQNYAMAYAYETKGFARSSEPINILRHNEQPYPIQFDETKRWFRKTDLISGFEKPAILVDYKQNHSLFGWSSNLGELIKDEQKENGETFEKSPKVSTELVEKENKRNNHFEIFRLNWDPIPYIKLSNSTPEGFFRSEYPLQSGCIARPVTSEELQNMGFTKDKKNIGEKIRNIEIGLQIVSRGQPMDALNPQPFVIRDNDKTIIYGKVRYLDYLSKEGESKIYLYCVEDTNEQEKNTTSNYSKLEFLGEDLQKNGIKMNIIKNNRKYVIGYQPVAEDGRKGLVYLSRPFRLDEISFLNSSR